jgi:hypothetical protein
MKTADMGNMSNPEQRRPIYVASISGASGYMIWGRVA